MGCGCKQQTAPRTFLVDSSRVREVTGMAMASAPMAHTGDDFGQAIATAAIILFGGIGLGAAAGAWLLVKHRVLGALLGAAGGWVAAEIVLYAWASASANTAGER